MFAGGDKLGSLGDVEFKAVKCNIYQNPEKAKTNDNCVTNYRPACDPHESKGGEIRYKILRFAQHCFVASFGSMFRVFHLA